MFQRRFTIQVLIAFVTALCYLLLAGASAVHEVTHIGEMLSSSSTAGMGAPSAFDSGEDDGHGGDHDALPCFLCLSGHPYSLLHSISPSPVRIATGVDLSTGPAPELVRADRRLPSQRGPPFLS